MRIMSLAISMALGGLIASTALAQQSQTTESIRAERKQEARDTARNPKVGEGDAIPEPKAKVPREERAQARQARKPEAASEARAHRVGEGNPVPEVAAKVPRAERAEARAERKAESRRANKAGEITSKGEISY